MIRVATANFYVGNTHPRRDAKLLMSLGTDLAGIQEGHSGNAVAIKAALPTRTVWWRKYASRYKDKNLAATDVPVVVDADIDTIKFWGRQICVRSQKENIGMPRAATMVRFRYRGKTVTFINTHWNAAVQDPHTKRHLPITVKRVAQFVAGCIVTEAIIHFARLRGDLVILTGDLNYLTVPFTPWRYSPQGLFRRTKLAYRNNGLDYIAYSKAFKATNKHVIDKSRTGSDHDWLLLDLNL